MPTPELAADALRGSEGGPLKAEGATTAAMVASGGVVASGGLSGALEGSDGGDFWLSIARWKRHKPNLKGA